MITPAYAEIGITTNFSFLRGGSDPRAYVHQASELRLPVIGIADHNTLAGVVRAYKELDILGRLQRSLADGLWLAASLLYRGDDRRRLARLHGIAITAGVPLLATNEVLYHHPSRRPLQDVLTCIREKTTIDAIGRRLEANAERYLKPADEMAWLFRDVPEAIGETMRFAGRIKFALDQLKYQYPDEPVPPRNTAQRHLEDLTWQGAHKRFPIRISPKTRKVLHKEMRLIRKLKYENYFLTVHDIIRYAR